MNFLELLLPRCGLWSHCVASYNNYIPGISRNGGTQGEIKGVDIRHGYLRMSGNPGGGESFLWFIWRANSFYWIIDLNSDEKCMCLDLNFQLYKNRLESDCERNNLPI